MLAAPSLRDILSHRQDHPGALCCILFAPPFSKVAREGIIPRIGYLNNRSATDIHFYCAGYGGYWHIDDFPDMEAIGDVRYDGGTVIPWSFSQKCFSAFVDELEIKTAWKYSGETEMIVFDSAVAFTDCLVLDIERMVKDDAIDRASEIFESLIQYARTSSSQPTAYGFSDGKAPSIFGKAILNALCEGPKSVGKTWKAGRHFATRSIAK
jgi:hypothetical protein